CGAKFSEKFQVAEANTGSDGRRCLQRVARLSVASPEYPSAPPVRKNGSAISRRAFMAGVVIILPSLRPRLRWIRECVGIKRDWHNRSVAVVRVAVLRTLLDQTDLRRRRGPVACQI